MRLEGMPCIPFAGKVRKNGYGYTQFLGRQYLAHRLAYALNEWRHPNSLRGTVIRHRCDNPRCINVDHLEPGTQRDNMADMVARGRHTFGERSSASKLTADQVAAIRAEYRPRSRDNNQRAIAARYGISQSEVSHIVTAKRWTHL